MSEAEAGDGFVGVTLALDTSVARKAGVLLRIANGANRGRERGIPVRVVIPALAHAEALFHYRRRLGLSFNARLIDQSLRDKAITVVPFDGRACEVAARHLWTRFPSDDAWQGAKSARLSGVKGRPPATVDWYLAAHASPWLIVSDDEGPEFEATYHLTSAEVLALLTGGE